MSRESDVQHEEAECVLMPFVRIGDGEFEKPLYKTPIIDFEYAWILST